MEQVTINLNEFTSLSNEELAEKYFAQALPVRKAIYSHLPAEKQAFLRPLVEAKRGIKRDENGVIIRDKKFKAERKLALEAKLADLENRVANINAELESLN